MTRHCRSRPLRTGRATGALRAAPWITGVCLGGPPGVVEVRQAVIVSEALDAAEEQDRTCWFCGGPASGSGEANLLLRSTPGSAAVCGRCIESHADLLRQVNERRRQGGDT